MGKSSARASPLPWEAHTGNVPTYWEPVHPQRGCERQQTLTWDLPEHARAARSGQEIPSIPCTGPAAADFWGELWGALGQRLEKREGFFFWGGGVSPAPSLELGFDLRAGKTRGGERPRQMDAAQKSHLIYGGFEERGRKERRGTDQAATKKKN